MTPAAASAQQPYYPDPVPLNRPAGGVEAAGYLGAAPGSPMMSSGYAQAPVPPPPGTAPVDPNLLPPPRPLPGAGGMTEPRVDMNQPAEGGSGSRWILSADFYTLMRARMNHEALAIKDLVLVEAPDPVPPGLDGMPLAIDAHNLNNNLMYGVRGGIQCLFAEHNSVEWTVSWIPQHTDHSRFVMPGQLTSFFTGPETILLGFEGDNGLWDHADQMDFNLTTTIFNTEFNYRGYGGVGKWEFNYLLGLRYLNIREKLAWTTDDDGIVFGADPLFTATYTVRARNSIIAPQIGGGLQCTVCDWFALSGDVKLGFGENNASYVIELQRGDGFSAPSGGMHKDHFAEVFEGALSADFSGTWWRVRLGYNFLAAHGVATGINQIDFNLDNRNGAGKFDGTLFYHGPFASLNIVF